MTCRVKKYIVQNAVIRVIEHNGDNVEHSIDGVDNVAVNDLSI